MAWRIHDQITHGEIDNRQPGLVEGRLWLAGNDEPIRLNLKGNCWSDLAGCLLKFWNPSPDSETSTSLDRLQEGVVGDMTASRKVRVPTVDRETVSRLIQNKESIPTRLGNCVYLEWFSEANGRVVIEAAHYECELSTREWTMDPEQETDQRRQNETNLQDFLQNLVNQQSLLDFPEDEEDQPLDEFQWEQLLRQSDKITDQYLEALEKYRDDPDCDRLVAEEMGWDWLIEEEDLPLDNPLYDFVKEATGEEVTGWNEDDDEEEENGLWDEDETAHPLAERGRKLACRVYKTTEERGLLEHNNNPLHSLLTGTSVAAAKLAGALNILFTDDLPDYGFIIATLKRSLTPLHQSIAATEKIAQEMPEESTWLKSVREELFLIRQEVLTLMQTFRQKLQD